MEKRFVPRTVRGVFDTEGISLEVGILYSTPQSTYLMRMREWNKVASYRKLNKESHAGKLDPTFLSCLYSRYSLYGVVEFAPEPGQRGDFVGAQE